MDQHRESRDYFQKKGVNQILESVVTGLSYNRPESPLTYIEECINEIRKEKKEANDNLTNSLLRWDMFLPMTSKESVLKRQRNRKNFTFGGRIGEHSPNYRLLGDAPTTTTTTTTPGSRLNTTNNNNSSSTSTTTNNSRPITKNSNHRFQGYRSDSTRSLLNGFRQVVPPIKPKIAVQYNAMLQQYSLVTSNIVFVLGGPGTGKGTQCEKLAKEFNYIHISAGDLLRAEVSRASSLGTQIQQLMKEGKIVPSSITLSLLKEELEKYKDESTSSTINGILLDGFPRQLDQAIEFEKQVSQCKFVLVFSAPENILQERLLKRGETSGRQDDNIETIQKRFNTFVNTSQPVIDNYAKIGRVVEISSIESPDIVYNRTKEYFVPSETRGLAWRNIVFVLGGPGCGKGTQCDRIVQEFRYNNISCGDLLRAEVASGSARGRELEALMKEGKIVSIDVTLTLLREAMMKCNPNAPGFLIDGFPRQIDQARAFEATIAPCKFVLYFECPEKTLEQRLLKRGETSGRADDNIATIKKRFATFIDTSYPVIEEYAKVGKCVKVSSVPAPDDVYQTTREHFLNPMDRGTAWQNIVFVLGGPGCGKGTQCERIVKEYGYNHISCGDLLRNEVATGSKRGKSLDALMKEGKIVPVEITLELLREAMLKSPPNSGGFLIDGFPRQIDQARAFEATIAPCKFALYFECSEEVLEKRLLKRGETSGRADDNIETIKKRFNTFITTSYPVIQAYESIGKCVKISSESPPNEVYLEVQQYFVPSRTNTTTAQSGGIFTRPGTQMMGISSARTPLGNIPSGNNSAVSPLPKSESQFTPATPDLQLKSYIPLNHPNIIFVLGGPGSGKGTMCTRIAAEFNLKHLSTGDLLRDQVNKRTDIGVYSSKLMKEGKIVPMSIMIELLYNAIQENINSQGFLLDGFPRAVDQAIEFEERVGPCRAVICFNCPLDTLQERLLERGKTSGRSDDNMETIQKRFETYEQQSIPAIHHYKKQGKVVSIDSSQTIEQVYEETRQAMISLQNEDESPFSKAKIVFVLGGPGSGKGTQCERIVNNFGFCHISSGDLLREQVKLQTAIGIEIDELMKNGQMVPLEITLQLLLNAMDSNSGAPGFLIDGFPRTMEQAKEFEKSVGKAKFILYFDSSEDTLTKRLLKRGETSGRSDDHIDSIKKRLEAFKEVSLPVIEYFREDGRVKTVISEGSIEDIECATSKFFEKL